MKNPVQIGLLLLTLTAVAVFGYNVDLRETTPPARSYSDFLADLRAAHEGAFPAMMRDEI